MKDFITSENEVVNGKRLSDAIKKVGRDWNRLAKNMYKENAYASHVTEETKINNLKKMVADSIEIRQGEIKNFTIWQRINTELTGKCVPLLN